MKTTKTLPQNVPKNKGTSAQLPFAKGITIDPRYSKDLDDSVLLRDLGKGQYMVDICIAQVVDLVPLHKQAYKQAYNRVTTLYHANGNEPMLARSLADKKASLLPNSTKKAVLVRILINKNTLKINSVSVKEVMFKSLRKMHHAEVDAIIKGEKEAPKAIVIMLRKLDKLAENLLACRRASGAMAMYDINKGWKTNEEGRLIRISDERTHRAEIIIQEMMIMANRLLAEWLMERKVEFIVRNHTAKITEFSINGVMKEYEHFLVNPNAAMLPQIQEMCNIYMNRASYGVESVGHIGLSLALYAHFTSPIRRLSDLINQYILVSYLRGEQSPFTKEALMEVTKHMNERLDKLRNKVASTYIQKEAIQLEFKIKTQKTIIGMKKEEIRGIVVKCLTDHELLALVKGELLQHISAGILEPADICRIIFATEAKDGIVELQEAVLKYFSSNSFVAKSVMEIAEKKQHIKSYMHNAFLKDQAPICFINQGVCTLKNNELCNATDVLSPTKKGGDQMCCIIIFAQIMNLPVPQIQYAKKSSGQTTGILQALPEVINDDYTSALYIFTQLQKIDPPVYDCKADQTQCGYFTTTASMGWNKKILKASSQLVLGKKAAKNGASKAIYQKLQSKLASK